MSNHNSLPTKKGFTLVEMLIIAPIVVLVIGIFVSAIVSMTGDVLSVRSVNNMTYNIQNALDTVSADVKASGGYLATNSITPLLNGQGYDNGIAAFNNVNSDTSIGSMLIINSYATTANPLSSARSYVYLTGQPNACSSSSVSQNSKLMTNIVYFVKNKALWRRIIMPSTYNAGANVNCNMPWQKPTCVPGYNSTDYTFCKSEDIKLVDGVQSDGFTVNYYTSAAPTTVIPSAIDSSQSNTVRQTALQTASSIKVEIDASKTIAGRTVSQTGSIRTSSSQDIVKLAYKRPITITNSSGGTLTNYQVQINPFSDAAFLNNNGLVGSWHLNEGSGTTTTDSSGYNNTGTMTGTSYWNSSGKFGSGLSGNGSTNKVTTADSSSLTLSSSFTIEAWINPTSLPTAGNLASIVSKYDGSGNQGGYDLRLKNNAGTQSIGLTTISASADGGGDINYTLAAGTWSHVVGVYDGSNSKIYVNGSYVGQAANTVNPADNTKLLNIGGFGYYTPNSTDYGRYFNGKIDEVKIYNRALSATEISNRYGTSGTPKVRSDYGDVRFKDTTGTTEYPYWQETDGKYWVKIPSLATGDTTINMYYGNASVASSSSGDNTFIFFDDFESGNLNKWNSNVGTPLIGSAYAFSGGYGGRVSSTTCADNMLKHVFSVTPMSSVIATYRRLIVNGNSYAGIYGPLATDSRLIGADIAAPTSYTIYDNAYNAAASASVAIWRQYKVTASPTATTYYTDGAQIPYTTNRAGTFNGIQLYSCSGGGLANFDDVVVRQYAATEPTHTAPGAEVAN